MEALRGRIRPVYRFRLKQQLDRIDFIESQLAALEAEIESLAKRGRKRAVVAVSHALLVTSYYLLKRKCPFKDLGGEYFDRLNYENLTRYFVKRLARLGHTVKLEPAAASA